MTYQTNGTVRRVLFKSYAWHEPTVKYNMQCKDGNWNVANGNTGNPVVDICKGRELSPWFLGADFKLTLFRISMISLAMVMSSQPTQWEPKV